MESPVPIPTPIRTWEKDSLILYSVTPEFNTTFLMTGQNVVFMMGVVNPTVLDISSQSGSGSLVFDPTASNITVPFLDLGITETTFRQVVFNQILGTYTCSASNVFGTDTATTIIRECGECVRCVCSLCVRQHGS